MTNPVVAHEGKKLRIEWKHDHEPGKFVWTSRGGTVDPKVRVRGITVCLIKDEKGGIPFSGRAFCSKKDTYIREKGRKHALKNAIKDLPREERGKFWYAYFARLDGMTDAALEKMLGWKSRRKRRKALENA